MSTVVEQSTWETANPDKKRDIISRQRLHERLENGLLSRRRHDHRCALSQQVVANIPQPPGKTALVAMSFLASFTIDTESRIVKGAHNPQMYWATIDGSYVEKKQETSKLKRWQQGANFLYDHPYRALITVGVPLVGGIYGYQHLTKGISTSQQIMHTRIYGQASVVVLLLSSMAFHDYMAKRGKFGEEETEA